MALVSGLTLGPAFATMGGVGFHAPPHPPVHTHGCMYGQATVKKPSRTMDSPPFHQPDTASVLPGVPDAALD